MQRHGLPGRPCGAQDVDMSDESVILIHGVWMRAFSLLLLRRRLREAGFHTELFDYASVMLGNERSVERLGRRIRAQRSARVHLVGHSLGGLVALRSLAQLGAPLQGNIVCLGSPLNGSAVARRVAGWPGGTRILGGSLRALCDGLPAQAPESVKVGVIAGTRAMGLGQLAGVFQEPNDGTVAVAETRWPAATEHCEVDTSHTGLVVSREAAELTVRFLRGGRFAPEPTQP
jgi:pimeloyl-ACP methyl ester carboxylesterase